MHFSLSHPLDSFGHLLLAQRAAEKPVRGAPHLSQAPSVSHTVAVFAKTIAERTILDNIRHDLDPVDVEKEIKRAVDELRAVHERRKAEVANVTAQYAKEVGEGTAHRNFPRTPETLATLDMRYQEYIRLQLEHYSKVRVIELPTNADKRFVLAYGDQNDSGVTNGTGPGVSVDEIAGWFLRGGR